MKKLKLFAIILAVCIFLSTFASCDNLPLPYELFGGSQEESETQVESVTRPKKKPSRNDDDDEDEDDEDEDDEDDKNAETDEDEAGDGKDSSTKNEYSSGLEDDTDEKSTEYEDYSNSEYESNGASTEGEDSSGSEYDTDANEGSEYGTEYDTTASEEMTTEDEDYPDTEVDTEEKTTETDSYETSGGSEETESSHTHSYGKWKTTKQATCTEEGVKERRCSCGDVQTQAIKMLDHDVVAVPGHESTCFENGISDGLYCASCGAVFKEQMILPLAKHVLNYVEGKEPTCVEDGWYSYEACENCSYSTYTPHYAYGHDWREADCENPTTCLNCGITTDGALGHDWYVYDIYDPTCTENGVIYYECQRDDCWAYYEEYIPATGHDWMYATCENPTTCMACAETYGEPLGHDWYAYDIYDPTCTEEGIIYYECQNCWTTYEESIPATGHDWMDADCTTPKTCSACGETYGEPLGHDWMDANCYAPKTCWECGATEGEALGHDINYASAQTPTCTEVGWDSYEYCLRCDYSTRVDIPTRVHKVEMVDKEIQTFENYTLKNATNYPFTTTGGVITSTNKAASSSATYTLTALRSFTLDMKYKVSSESGYDCLTIKQNSTQKAKISGETSWYTLTLALNAGDTVTFTYSKDGSVNHGSDCAYIELLTPQTSTIENITVLGYCDATEEYLDSILLDCSDEYLLCADCNVVLKTGHQINSENTCELCGHYMGEGVEFTLSNGKYSVTDYTGSATEVIIPSIYNGLPVTSIGDYAFYGCSSLTNIIIPESVTSIGNRAFYGCSQLTCLTLPDSIETIGEYAFAECSSLEYVHINKSISSIRKDAFNNCTALTGVYISDIAEWCNTSFSNANANPLYWANALYLNGELVTDLVIPASVTTIKFGVFYGYEYLTSVSFEEGSNLTTINKSAFCYCSNIESISLPETLTQIGEYAFYDCQNLTNITIPYNVRVIGAQAFYNCTSLTSVTFMKTENWGYFSSSDATSGYVIPNSGVADPTTAATYITSTYTSYWWKWGTPTS